MIRLVILSAVLLAAAPATAAEQRTWNYLTTGNGHGFQVYDAQKNKIVSFLEHPYRYLKPRPDPKSDGIGRRNLAFDFYFGLKGGWLNAAVAGEVSYLEESNIILAKHTLGGSATESYFFAPFGYEGNAMVAVLKAPGASDGFALFNFHLGNATNPDQPDAIGESMRYVAASQAVVETGPGGGAMIYVPLAGVDHSDCAGPYAKVTGGGDLGDKNDCAGNDLVHAFQRKLGADGMMAVAMQFVENAADADAAAAALKAWANGRTPQQILDDARAEFTAWRKAPPANAVCSDVERKLWRQSETVLRMGQVREPYSATRKNHGMMLASLPPGEWHSGWVRDGMYAVVALARSGHHAEAKLALDFFLNAAPVGKFASFVSNQTNYRISVVRYFGNGEEEADYSGQSTPNVEIDGWGMFMWAARQYVEASGDLAWLDSPTQLGPTVWDSMVSGVAGPLEANLETNGIAKADSSIWEVHDQNKRHFAYTTLAAARGFCDMAATAKKASKADVAKYQMLAQKVRTGFLATFLDSQGSLGGSLEEIQQNRADDGAVAEAFTWNVMTDWQGTTAKQTLKMFDRLRVSSGGFKRNDDGVSSYDSNEWILVDLRIANSLRRAGHAPEADGYLQPIIDKAAANFFLVPELYNAVPADGQIGKYTGSIPMVGYGGGAYIITMLDRSGAGEPNDCGDGVGTVLASFTCAGGPGPTPDGGIAPGGDGGSGPGGNGGKDIPYVGACYCDLHRGRSSSDGVWLIALGALGIVWARKRRIKAD